MKYRIAYRKNHSWNFILERPTNSEGEYEVGTITRAIYDMQRWSKITGEDYKLVQVNSEGDITIINNLSLPESSLPVYKPLHPLKSKGLLTWLKS